MNRLEAWESAIKGVEEVFVRGEFEKDEWEVEVNNGVGTITLIHRPSRTVMVLTDTTGYHYDAEDRLVPPQGAIHEKCHAHRGSLRLSQS